jgi:rod shape-determining protein MreD
MTFLVGLPLLALAAALQATVLAHWPILGGVPDLVLLVVLGWTLAGDWPGGITWGFTGGVFLDLLSGGPFGAFTTGLTLMAYLASLSEGRFWRSHVLLPLATVGLATLGLHLINLTFLAAAGYPVQWGADLLRFTLPALLLNTLAMLPVYHALRWLQAALYPPTVTA